MLKPVSDKTDKHRADLEANDDFNITELLAKLNTYSDADFDSPWIQPQQQELETLAAILISQLTHSINGKLIAWTSADIAWEEDLYQFPKTSLHIKYPVRANSRSPLLYLLPSFGELVLEPISEETD